MKLKRLFNCMNGIYITKGNWKTFKLVLENVPIQILRTSTLNCWHLWIYRENSYPFYLLCAYKFIFSILTTIKTAFTKPYETPLSWISVLTTILVVICLALTKHYFTAICVLLILLATIILVIYESYLRRTEIFRKVRLIVNEIQLAQILCRDWTTLNYPNVSNPMSPCVTLQWTYRDGKIVNLPWALLVKGDVIVIRPGQSAPGYCVEITGKTEFKTGETYGLAQV